VPEAGACLQLMEAPVVMRTGATTTIASGPSSLGYTILPRLWTCSQPHHTSPHSRHAVVSLNPVPNTVRHL
jgi:hypothetical protein